MKLTPSHHFQCLARLSIAQSGGVAWTGKADLPLPLVFFPIPLCANIALSPFHWLRKYMTLGFTLSASSFSTFSPL